MLLKEALFRRHEALKGIPSIKRARKVNNVEYDLLNVSHLQKEVDQSEEWFAVSGGEIIPIPAWSGDKLIDGLSQFGTGTQYTTNYLVCVENYFTPEVYVTIYVVKNLVSLLESALEREVEILGMRESAVNEWIVGEGEVCDD